MVTGGNSGIGFESAKELKNKGATVIITGRNPEKVNAAASELGVKGLVADVLDLSAIDAAVEQVVADLEGIGVATSPSGAAGIAALLDPMRGKRFGLDASSRVLCYISEGPA